MDGIDASRDSVVAREPIVWPIHRSNQDCESRVYKIVVHCTGECTPRGSFIVPKGIRPVCCEQVQDLSLFMIYPL
jgi:hypothetical protein